MGDPTFRGARLAVDVLEYLEDRPYENSRDVPCSSLYAKMRVMLDFAAHGRLDEANEMAEAFCFSLGAHLWAGTSLTHAKARYAGTGVVAEPLPRSSNVIQFRRRTR